MRTTPLASHRMLASYTTSAAPHNARATPRAFNLLPPITRVTPFVALRARTKNSVSAAPSAREPTPGGRRSTPSGPAPTPRRSTDHRSARPADRRKDRSSAAGHRTTLLRRLRRFEGGVKAGAAYRFDQLLDRHVGRVADHPRVLVAGAHLRRTHTLELFQGSLARASSTIFRTASRISSVRASPSATPSVSSPRSFWLVRSDAGILSTRTASSCGQLPTGVSHVNVLARVLHPLLVFQRFEDFTPPRFGCHRFCNRETGSERFLAAGSGGARENLCYNYASLRRGVVAAVVLISPVSEVRFLPPPPFSRTSETVSSIVTEIVTVRLIRPRCASFRARPPSSARRPLPRDRAPERALDGPADGGGRPERHRAVRPPARSRPSLRPACPACGLGGGPSLSPWLARPSCVGSAAASASTGADRCCAASAGSASSCRRRADGARRHSRGRGGDGRRRDMGRGEAGGSAY